MSLPRPTPTRSPDDADRRAFAATSRVSWALTLGLLIVTVTLALAAGVSFQPGLASLNIVVGLVFAPVGVFYTYVRFDKRIAGLCDVVAIMVIFTLVAAVYTYVATIIGAGVPLRDQALFDADQALGLDWRAYLAWLDGYPHLGLMFEACYESILKQVAVLLACLAVLGDMRRLQIFILAVQLALLVCGTAPALMPALGVYSLLHVSPALDHPHLWLPAAGGAIQEIERLRAVAPFIRLDTIVGVVVFPSFHTVLAVLFAWAFWPVPVVRWIALALNAGMLAATPLSGGHYFVDVLAGFVLALAALTVAHHIVGIIERRAANRLDRRIEAAQPA